MYWTDWEEDPKDSRRGRLERAWMDGSHRDVFVTSKTVLWPNGLSLDIPAGRLYWVDAFYDRIETIMLNGTDRKVGGMLLYGSGHCTWLVYLCIICVYICHQWICPFVLITSVFCVVLLEDHLTVFCPLVYLNILVYTQHMLVITCLFFSVYCRIAQDVSFPCCVLCASHIVCMSRNVNQAVSDMTLTLL